MNGRLCRSLVIGIGFCASLMAVPSDAALARTSDEDPFTASPASPASPDSPNGVLVVGNRIFRDVDNDGVYNTGAGDAGLAGVRVNLYLDDGTTAGLLDGDDTLQATGSTGGGGLYTFTGLDDGDYIIQVPQVNFNFGGALVGMVTSDGNDLGDGTAPDPDNDLDNDDNGDDVSGLGVASKAVTLAVGTEPVGDGDGANGNLTVDLGFTGHLCIGDLIFDDLDNNGVFDGSDVGIGDVDLELYRDDGDGLLDGDDDLWASGSSDTSTGAYEFCSLIPADYILLVPDAEFGAGQPLEDYFSSTGNNLANGTAPDPDDDNNGDDNGYPVAGFGTASKAIRLIFNNEPVNGTGKINNPTLDMGFVALTPSIEIQKTVYQGHDSGAGCTGVELVTEIADADITYCFVVKNTDDLIYLDDIQVDDIALGIDQEDLTPLGELVFPLAPGASVMGYYETTVAGDLLNTASTTGNPTDQHGNDTPGAVDPIDDDTAEVDEVLPGIVLEKTVYPGHDDGAGCAGTDLIGASIGDAITYCFEVTNPANSGVYLDDVIVDDGDLAIDRSDMTLLSGTEPTAPGGVLVFYYETTVAGVLLNTADTSANPTYANGDDLPGLTDPTDEDTAEVVQLCLGDAVFFDLDNSGTLGAGEFGRSDVLLKLYSDTDDSGTRTAGDTLIDSTTTDGLGAFQFCDLRDDNYVIEVAPANFDAEASLELAETSDGLGVTPSDPDDNVNNDDDGGPDPLGGISTFAVTMAAGTEPINDGDSDPHSNLSIDFGFKQKETPTGVWLGGFVAEPGEDGASVELTWWTLQETGVLGFDLLRSSSLDQAPARVNKAMIPALDARSGSRYAFVDPLPAEGSFYYWLEVIGGSGARERFGAVAVHPVRKPAQVWSILLPFLAQRQR